MIDAEGHLLTNNHVVEGATQISVKLGSYDKSYPAKVVGADPATDVALLKVDVPADKLHPLALGDSSELEVGDPVVAIGNPFGLDRTVTSGIVSALQRQIEAPNGFSISHVIQTDAAINPGNSGGPLIDAEGRVVGINSQIETGGGGRQRRHRLRDPDQHGARSRRARSSRTARSSTPTWGSAAARSPPISPRRSTCRSTKASSSPRRSRAARPPKPGSKAATPKRRSKGRASRLGGDIITELDGKKISSMEELVNVVNGKKPGEDIEVTLLRGGDEKTVTVKLANRPASIE